MSGRNKSATGTIKHPQHGQTISTAVPTTTYYTSEDPQSFAGTFQHAATPVLQSVSGQTLSAAPNLSSTVRIRPTLTNTHLTTSSPVYLHQGSLPTLQRPTPMPLPFAYRTPTPLYYTAPISAGSGAGNSYRQPVQVLHHRCDPKRSLHYQQTRRELDEHTRRELEREKQVTLELTRDNLLRDKLRKYKEYNKRLLFERHGLNYDPAMNEDVASEYTYNGSRATEPDEQQVKESKSSKRQKSPRRAEDCTEDDWRILDDDEYEDDYMYHDVRPNPYHFRNLALLYQSCE